MICPNEGQPANCCLILYRGQTVTYFLPSGMWRVKTKGVLTGWLAQKDGFSECLEGMLGQAEQKHRLKSCHTLPLATGLIFTEKALNLSRNYENISNSLLIIYQKISARKVQLVNFLKVQTF